MTLTATVFVVFLILKLCHLITWSWWIVTSPLWITAGFNIVKFLFAGLDSL